MGNNAHEYLLKTLPQDQQTALGKFSKYARQHVLDKIKEGYSISKHNFGAIVVVKQNTFYNISNQGVVQLQKSNF